MNKQRNYLLMFLLVLVGATTWWFTSRAKPLQTGLFILNVLDADCYQDCHIQGSLNVSLENVEQFVANIDKQKAEIVVYCSNYMCTTSEFVCKKLTSMGFQNVWAYEGGMAEWFQAGLPTQGPASMAYLTTKVEAPLVENHEINVITMGELRNKMELSSKAA